MEAHEMINGEIYFVETYYQWIIRFKEINGSDIIGYGCVTDGRYSSNYLNLTASHTNIRLATAQERELYELKETDKPIIFKEIIFN